MKMLVSACFAVFALRRLVTYLHIFQQEEYDGVRFVRWMVRRAAFDRRATILLAAIGCVEAAGVLSQTAGGILAGSMFLTLAYFEADPRSSGKKRLVMTARAKRILAGAVLAAVACGFAAGILPGLAWIWIIAVHSVLPGIEQSGADSLRERRAAAVLARSPRQVGATQADHDRHHRVVW